MMKWGPHICFLVGSLALLIGTLWNIINAWLTKQ